MVVFNTKPIVPVTIISGIGGMVGQLILLRELMIVFYGNELVMGLILSNWLILESLGALLAGKIKTKQQSCARLYLVILSLYAFSLPASIYLSRIIDQVLFGVLPGQTAGIFVVFISSLLLAAAVSLVHGALFPLGCRLLWQAHRETKATGKIYLYENIGSLAAGMFFTLFLARRFNALQIGLGISLVSLAAAGLLLVYLNPGYSLKTRFHQTGVPLNAIVFLLLLSIGLAIFPKISTALHEHSLERQWRGQEVVHYQNTPYGNIVVTRSESSYTYFYDARMIASLPVPELAKISDFAHLSMLSHPDPQQILIIGGGLGGLLHEVQRHPSSSLIYAELDPDLPEIMQIFEHDLIQKEMADPRLSLIKSDGRRYLSQADEQFDVIMIGFITPETLQTNRLFTHEFFSIVSDKLNDGGLFAFTVPGSDVFYSAELADLNASIYRTLEKSFAHLLMIPGDLNLFLASDQPLDPGAKILLERILARDLDLPMFSDAYLSYRLAEDRIEWSRSTILSSTARMNDDFHPASFYYALNYWGRTFSPEIRNVFNYLERLDLGVYALLFLLLPTLFFVLGNNRKKRLATHYTIWTTGIVSMSFDLLLLFIFQSLFGVIYQMTGLLMAVFMSGILLGGLFAVRYKKHNQQRLYFLLEILLISCPLLLMLTLAVSQKLPQTTIMLSVTGVMVIMLSTVAGFFAGAQFPFAADMINKHKDKIDSTRASGQLYAADLLGGWMGGLIVTLILFPLLGVLQTLLLLSIIKAGSLGLLVLSDKTSKLI